MSYRKGFEAFLARIQRAFPLQVSEQTLDRFNWTTEMPGAVEEVVEGRRSRRCDLVKVDGIHLPDDKDYANSGYLEPVRTYRVFDRIGTKILTVQVNLLFGIRLEVTSPFWARKESSDRLEGYGTHYYVYRRPLRLCFANTHGKRHWLRNKPKFARDGAFVANIIKRSYMDSV